MKFYIPKHCHIRWQAALAVLEDLQEDKKAPFDMDEWADAQTLWEKTNGCGSAACYAGYISVSPYCRKLGFPKGDRGPRVIGWLLDNPNSGWVFDEPLYEHLFRPELNQGSRAKTLEFLERRLKKSFKESTGKNLVAPLTFYY